MPSSIVFQTEVGRHLRPKDAHDEGSLFAYAVRNALRRKPTIILIGEARDRATIQASVEAALTGHLLFTTMHTIGVRSEEHKSELQSLMRISYAVFCLKKKKKTTNTT